MVQCQECMVCESVINLFVKIPYSINCGIGTYIQFQSGQFILFCVRVFPMNIYHFKKIIGLIFSQKITRVIGMRVIV